MHITINSKSYFYFYLLLINLGHYNIHLLETQEIESMMPKLEGIHWSLLFLYLSITQNYQSRFHVKHSSTNAKRMKIQISVTFSKTAHKFQTKKQPLWTEKDFEMI